MFGVVKFKAVAAARPPIVTYATSVNAPLTLLLDDNGATVFVTDAQADELFPLLSSRGIKCRRQLAANGVEIRFPDAHEVLMADRLLRNWSAGQLTPHTTKDAEIDTWHP